jgi:phosphoesterase RecJ-like protein
VVTPKGVAYLKNAKEDVQAYGIDLFSLSRGMVNIMSGIRGIEAWVNFTEDPATGKVYVELRSNGLNVNQIAVKYGGGGHLMASGATIDSFEVADKMIDDLNRLTAGEYNDATDIR